MASSRMGRMPAAHDTQALKQLVAEKKLESDKILAKITKLKAATKERKESSKSSDHKFLWLEESRALNDERKALEQDIERTLREFASTKNEGEIGFLFSEIVKENSENSLTRQTTMNDILGGIRDLHMSLQQNRTHSPSPDGYHFRERLSAIKIIVAAQIASLESDEISLEHEISQMRSSALQRGPSFAHSTSFASLSESPFHSPTTTPRPYPPSSTTTPRSYPPSSTTTPRAHAHSAASTPHVSRPSSASTAHSIAYSSLSSVFSDSSQLTDSSLIFQFDQLPCQDVQLVENLHDEWNKMEQRFNKQLTDLRTRFLQENGVADVKLGTWDAKAHFHFMTLYKQYVHKGRREEFVDRVAVEMPNQDRYEIEDHLQFVRKQYLYRIHQKAIKGMWRRERTQWFESAKELVREANLLAEQKIRKDIEASEMQHKKEHLQKKVEAWRDEKAKKFAQAMEDLRREEQKALEKERVLNERLARAKNVKKNLVSEYKQIKKDLSEQKAIEEEQKRRELDCFKKEQEEVNKERINYRIEEMELKNEAKAQKKLEDQKMEQLKQIQLEKLRETVRVRAESDTARTQQGTVASTTLARNLPPLFKSNQGYTAESITNDTRFKVERALEKAGLLHSKYAQEVLSSIQTKVRIDQLSSEQKEMYIKARVA